MNDILNWYVGHKDLINLIKDVVFVIGATATFVGFYQLVRFLVQRRTLNKRQEMDNDARLYAELHDGIKDHIDGYNLEYRSHLRDISVILLHIKNYPNNFESDGFKHNLYYYIFDRGHKPSGYISSNGIYVIDFLRQSNQSIYYNFKNGKWFISEENRKVRKYDELNLQHLVKRIPFANIFGYDFHSDWADYNEPVLFTKYKYTSWKLFANEFEAITWKDGEYPSNKLTLQKSKRARRIRTFFVRTKNRIRGYFSDKRSQKLLNQQQAKWKKH